MNVKVKVIEKHYQLKNILTKLDHTLNNLKKSGTWNIQLTITINFISSIDEERVMHSKSDSMEIMINDKADEIVEELFQSLRNRYQNNFEKLMKESDFVFNYLHLLHRKFRKVNPNCSESYVDSSDWKKSNSKSIQ